MDNIFKLTCVTIQVSGLKSPTVFTSSFGAGVDSIADFLEMAYYVLTTIVSGTSLSRLKDNTVTRKTRPRSQKP